MSTLTYTWDSSTSDQPADGDSPRYADDMIRETRALVEERLGREHILQISGVFDTNNQQGYHRPGSAIAYIQAAAPTNLPDGLDALADDDLSKGRLWIDTDTGALSYWDGTAFASIGAGSLGRINGLNSTDLEAWHSTYNAIEAYASAIMAGTASSALNLISNAYYDGTWKYKTTGRASMVGLGSGAVVSYIAASGSANAALTWVGAGKKVAGYVHGACTENEVFDALAPCLPVDGDTILVHGTRGNLVVNRAVKTTSGRITLYGGYLGVGDVYYAHYTYIDNGDTDSAQTSLSW